MRKPVQSCVKIAVVNPPASVSCSLAGLFLYRSLTEYAKPFLTFEQQADQLISRGMLCDRDRLVRHLEAVGYYRLSGYWYIFKAEDDMFEEETDFSKVWNLYTFDRQFRLVALDAVERVEVYFRTQLAYCLAETTGPFGFLSNSNLPRLSEDSYIKFIKKSRDAVSRSREPFVVHFKDKYGDSHDLPPYWVLVNTMDFGMMLTLYRGASVEVRSYVSEKLGITAKVLESWLVTLNTVRNICAHHGRLWNRTLGTKPMIPNRKKPYRPRCAWRAQEIEAAIEGLLRWSRREPAISLVGLRSSQQRVQVK
ncbi:Abi family protein, partial [Gordonibacter sp.]